MKHGTVQIIGLGDTIRALRQIDRDAAQQLNRDLKGIAGRVASEANAAGARVPSNMPLANDRREGYPQYGVERGKQRSGASFGFLVKGTNYNAALAEFAGSVTPRGFTPQGAALIRALNRKLGEPGRLGWAAFDRLRPALEADISAACAKAEGRCQAKHDRARDVR